LTVFLAATKIIIIISIEFLFGDLLLIVLPEVSRKNKGLQKIIGGQPVKKSPFLKANIHYHINEVSYAYIACLVK